MAELSITTGLREISSRLTELNPHAVEALFQTLRDATGTDDDRIRLLVRLWDALTGDH